MANRMFYRDFATAAEGLIWLPFSFQTNTAANPLPTSFRGGGVASVTHAATGIYLVTLADAYRYLVYHNANFADLASGSDDGAVASIGNVLNQGTALPITLNVFTRTAAGVKTDYAPRRVGLLLVAKNSSVGV